MFTRVRFNRKTIFRQMFTLAVDRNSCAHLVRWVEDKEVAGRYTVGDTAGLAVVWLHCWPVAWLWCGCTALIALLKGTYVFFVWHGSKGFRLSSLSRCGVLQRLGSSS